MYLTQTHFKYRPFKKQRKNIKIKETETEIFLVYLFDQTIQHYLKDDMVNGINKGLPRMAASNKLLGDIKVKAAFGIASNC